MYSEIDDISIVSIDDNEDNERKSQPFVAALTLENMSLDEKVFKPINQRAQSSHQSVSVISIDTSSSSDSLRLDLVSNTNVIQVQSQPEHHLSMNMNCGSHTDDSKNLPDSEGRVLVNVSHPSRDPDIYLAPQLSRTLKPHQIGGIRFLYDNIVGSIDKYRSTPGSGCILSHSMGLGKTIQTIAFIDVFLNECKLEAKHVICVVPVNTLQNWLNEFNTWIPDTAVRDDYFRRNRSESDTRYRTFNLFTVDEKAKTFKSRSKIISSWKSSGGVLLIGYEMFRILTEISDKHFFEEEKRKKLRGYLLRPDLLVCDEGHKIKNPDSLISKALKKVETNRRIVLTGYPIQNNLMEYWCMIDFVRPNYLGSKSSFKALFANPIKDGQLKNSTNDEKIRMKVRSYCLYQKLEGLVQRRCHSVLRDVLPPKTEFVIMCRMTEIQEVLMKTFLDLALKEPHTLGIDKINFFIAFAVCFKIWNHPDIVFNIYNKTCNASDDEVYEEKVLRYDWCEPILKQYKRGKIDYSNKMLILFEIIKETISCGDRLLIFSQSLLTLSLIEKFMESTKIPKTQTQWINGANYYRLDGSTQTRDREEMIANFNTDESVLVFLISTKAGSLGINLIGANRIVIFDANWNPCHDAQAACRIYRYGQKKDCFIYRLICDNSLEKTIFNKQINKQELADRVVDEKNVEPNFTGDDIRVELRKLLSIKPAIVQNFDEEEISSFSDHIIRRILINYSDRITQKPFTHESLLLHRKETHLADEEKRSANFQCLQNEPIIIDEVIHVSQVKQRKPNKKSKSHKSWYQYDDFPDSHKSYDSDSVNIASDSSQESTNFDSFTASLVGTKHSLKKTSSLSDHSFEMTEPDLSPKKRLDSNRFGTIDSSEESNVNMSSMNNYLENYLEKSEQCLTETNRLNQTITLDSTNTSYSTNISFSEDPIHESINRLNDLSIRTDSEMKTSTPITKHLPSFKFNS